MSQLTKYIDEICNCQAVSELWSIHCDAMNSFGFDRLVYGFTHYLGKNNIGPREDTMILYNHPSNYMKKLYGGDELYRHSPMLKWADDNVGACSWSWVRDNIDCFGREALQILEINRYMGVTAGCTISFPETSLRARGLIALTGKDGLSQADVDDIWKTDGPLIEAMNNVAHLKIISLPQQTDRAKLTSRQREVLEWVADGKTNQDIATIIGLSPATIEKHLRMAREKLGVSTTAQAILKISYLNQIHHGEN